VPGLSGYTPNITLDGYSEKTPGYTDRGSLFIKDRGDWQPEVPYKYWKAGSNHMLTIGDDSIYTTFKKD
jgi:hypothetical protein